MCLKKMAAFARNIMIVSALIATTKKYLALARNVEESLHVIVKTAE
jgi:hypothetical protein